MRLLPAIAATAMLWASAANAGVWQAEITVTDPITNFSFPQWTFTNQSSGTGQINGVSISNGPVWDWAYAPTTPGDPSPMLLPIGGTRTLVTGQEFDNVSNANNDDGGPTVLAYSLTGFDPGEFFRFNTDPEADNGTPAVIDIRSYLTNHQITVGVSFAGGPTLSGSNWIYERIDPQGEDGNQNQRYRIVLSQSFADPTPGVPEPATWGLMIAGFGMAGAMLRRRRLVAA